MTKRKKYLIAGLFFAFVVVPLATWTIRTVLVEAFKMPASSMEDTILVGDRILVNKLAFGIHIPFTEKKLVEFDPPRRGDVIVFRYPEDRSRKFVKRVIGLPGEKVEIQEKEVLINGAHTQRTVQSPQGGVFWVDSRKFRSHYCTSRLSVCFG